MNRRLDSLQTWLTGDSPFFSSFHSQIRDGAIAARGNGWDEQRISAENSVNPIYYASLQIGALSLDDVGLTYYGPFCVTLHEDLIRHRTTVFEENPFLFCKKHAVYAGTTPPPGYRAVWARRSQLASAKLGSKILSSTQEAEFVNILMGPNRNDPDCDFIEVQIYEKVHKNAIAAVAGQVPTDIEDRLVWKLVKRKLSERSIGVTER